MSQLRTNFLNWRPDLEDEAHDGLTVADNVIHEPEGYKEVHLASDGAFSTTSALAASNATVLSVVAKPVGSQDDLLVGYANSSVLNVGVNGASAGSSTTGYPVVSASGMAVTAFDVAELDGRIFFILRGQASSGAVTSVAGYMDFD